jgi:hypothetical protein
MVLFRTLLDEVLRDIWKKVHYFCRNVLQVEYAFCLAKVTASSKRVHHRIGMKINGRDLLWMALLRSHRYLFALFRCFCVLVSTMYEQPWFLQINLYHRESKVI